MLRSADAEWWRERDAPPALFRFPSNTTQRLRAGLTCGAPPALGPDHRRKKNRSKRPCLLQAGGLGMTTKGKGGSGAGRSVLRPYKGKREEDGETGGG